MSIVVPARRGQRATAANPRIRSLVLATCVLFLTSTLAALTTGGA